MAFASIFWPFHPENRGNDPIWRYHIFQIGGSTTNEFRIKYCIILYEKAPLKLHHLFGSIFFGYTFSKHFSDVATSKVEMPDAMLIAGESALALGIYHCNQLQGMKRSVQRATCPTFFPRVFLLIPTNSLPLKIDSLEKEIPIESTVFRRFRGYVQGIC